MNKEYYESCKPGDVLYVYESADDYKTHTITKARFVCLEPNGLVMTITRPAAATGVYSKSSTSFDWGWRKTELEAWLDAECNYGHEMNEVRKEREELAKVIDKLFDARRVCQLEINRLVKDASSNANLPT